MKSVSVVGRGSPQRRSLRVAARLLAAAIALTAAGAAAHTPAPLQLSLIDLLPQPGMRLPSTHLSARDMSAADVLSIDVKQPQPAYGASGARATLIEMPADVVPGRFNRPRYAIGFRSEAMKGFAKDMGLDADTCLMPLVRARVSLSQDSGASGRLMVFARCSFH